VSQIRPKISVIMSVYNEETYLSQAIESVLNQTFGDFEFIIIDDGSTDDSFEIIKSYTDQRIRLMKNESNIGLTRSLNIALGLAVGEYIARQDADDSSLPDRFAEQVSFLEKHPETVLLGTGVYVIDEGGKVLRREIPSIAPGQKLRESNQFVHGSVMFRRAAIAQLGLYQELFRYSQDYELWLRIASHHSVANLPNPLYQKRRHRESTQAHKRWEGALYHILALRMVDGKLSAPLLQKIEREGIASFYAYLERKERVYLHRSVARAHMSQENFTAARKEYAQAVRLAPYDIRTALSYLLCYLGNGVNNALTKMHHSVKSFLAEGKIIRERKT
jgi:glycosyltransferase involved in cell wall biosynthesis